MSRTSNSLQLLCLSSHGHEVVTTVTLALALHESSFVFKDAEGLLQASNLCLAAGLALLVCLRLSNAPLFDLSIVVHDGGKLVVGGLSVRGKLRNLLVQCSRRHGLLWKDQ